MAGYVCVVSGPSAAGKTSLVNAVMQAFPSSRISRVVTYTTRAPRDEECDGQDYHFIDADTFWRYQKAGAFIEYSCAYGACYASAWASLKEIPDNALRIMVIDRAGAYRVMQEYSNVLSIWIAPSCVDVLRGRLEQRGLAEGNIVHRLEQSERDMEQERSHPLYQHRVINDNFAAAYHHMFRIISQYTTPC